MIPERQAELEAVHAKYWAEKPTAAPTRQKAAPLNLSDDELLSRMFAAINGAEARRLFEGDTSSHGGDDSGADLALANHLGFWCGGDSDRIDRLFRRSGLMRPKWDERRGASTYGADTIGKALEGRTEFYTGAGGRPIGLVGAEAADDEADNRQCWTLRELLANPIELPPAVVPRVAWPGRVTLLAGREKVGKSTLTGSAVAAVTNGALFLAEATQQGIVLIATEEHVQDVARRMHALGADLDRLHVMVWRRDAIQEIREHTERIRPALLIVDTLAAVAEVAAPESGSSSQWARVMRPLVRIARDTGVALLILHHANKSDDSYRDSTEIGAAVDVILEMSETGGGAHRLIAYRGRYGRGKFTVELVGGGVYNLITDRGTDDLGGQIIDLVLREPGASQQAVIDGVKRRAADVRSKLADLRAAGRIQDLGEGGRHAYFVVEGSSGEWDDPRPEEGRSSGSSGYMGRGPDEQRDEPAPTLVPVPPRGGTSRQDGLPEMSL